MMTWRAAWAAWAVWAVWAARAAGAAGGADCPAGCDCATEDLRRYYCGYQQLKVRDDGYVEVMCKNNELNCSALPTLPSWRPSLQRLEVSQCALGSAPLACVARAAGAGTASPAALAVQDAGSALTEDSVKGLDVETIFMSFLPGAQTSVPAGALRSQRRLRSARLLSGTTLALGEDMFVGAPPLQYLEISMSGIQEIPANAFRGLDKLRILSLWGNNITRISVDAFTGLESLEQVLLNRNPLGALPPARAWPRAPRLRRVCADRTRLARVPAAAFATTQLQEIKLQSDSELILEPKAFSDLPSLTSLSLTSSKIPSLPPDLFHNTTSVVNLTLSGNRIAHIPDEVFQQLRALERLDLSRNRIEVLSKQMFENLASLTEINLDENKIQELPERVFGGLVRLRSASLAHNALRDVPPAALAGAAGLARLRLAHNALAWRAARGEPSSPFNMLMDLQWLDLSHNNISVVFSDWRFVLRRLRRLDLSHNAFTALSLSDVQFLGNLDEGLEVDFRHNQIFTLQPRALWSDTSNSGRVRILLADNPFACDCRLYDFLREIKTSDKYDVTSATCHQPEALRNELLTDVSPSDVTCPVPGAEPCTCVVRPALEVVECTCDDLSQVKDQSESGFGVMALRLRSVTAALDLPEYVRDLNLTGLGLEQVPEIAKTVQLLDLTRNSIKVLPKSLFHGNLSLYLSHNPLDCDCWSTEQVEMVQRHRRRILDYGNVTCSSGSRVSQVDAVALCTVYRSSVAGTLFALSLILVAILAAILYKYWIEIQVFLYSKGWCLYLLPREDADCGKKYDVFVSFAHEDEKFVCEQILPRLEERYTVHVRDRDWEVGATIPEQIRDSVEHSRRTLVLVSPHFVRSMWAAEEFRVLHTQASRDKRSRAVVVLLGISRKQLDKETRAFLSLSTILKYGERMFWNKVYYAMPRKDMYDYGGVEGALAGKKVDVWRGEGLNVVLNDEGKLINAGFVKDSV